MNKYQEAIRHIRQLVINIYYWKNKKFICDEKERKRNFHKRMRRNDIFLSEWNDNF